MPPLDATSKLSHLTVPELPVAEPRATVKPAPLLVRKPQHLAIILDGNGRWATAKGLPRAAGHVKGVESVRETVVGCLDYGIPILTLYAFSTLNWKRPAEEVGSLMQLFEHYLAAEAPRLAREGVRVRCLGDRERMPVGVREALDTAESRPVDAPRLLLNLAVNYGGREELVCAMRALAAEVARGGLTPGEIDLTRLEDHLYTRALPPVDLVIRTAGERRLSNFLLWQSAYAELYFTATLWPDFNREDLDAALADFAARKRTFGGLVDRAAPA